jgi:hypothetical protein
MKDEVAWVAIRRIVRHRKSPGFANARALEMGYLDWRKRAYNSRERSGREIVVEDVIGKEPNIEVNRALAEVFADLDKLVGQEKVKRAFHTILQFAQSNYKAELAGDQVRHMPMNRMFLGNPGTGKVKTLSISCSFSIFAIKLTFIYTEHRCMVRCTNGSQCLANIVSFYPLFSIFLSLARNCFSGFTGGSCLRWVYSHHQTNRSRKPPMKSLASTKATRRAACAP